MGFRETNRLEYLKQPHVLVLAVLVGVAIIAAIVTGAGRVQQMQRAANAGVYDACKEYISDDRLCRFAAANEAQGSSNSVVTSTTTNGETTEVTTLEIESPDRMKSITLNGLQETENYVIIDAVTYVKDLEDGVWAKYTDPDFVASEDGVSYDFSSANADDVVEFRDKYEYQGTEPCGDMTCHKYEVVFEGEIDITTYVWFDTEEYLLRRYSTSDPDTTTQTQFAYRDVSIEAPSPTKEVSEAELEAYL